ncbi:MAG: HNH endonuclease signature motif containing protein [Aurantimonas endophytica]|uniref:HNH endonuclease signature motif containing protein n=1 Tax=Aurantimonas endophytica TaxID=1522175 RepID=UPI003003137B
MRGERISYSADEMAWLEANRSMVISDYHRAFSAAFQRDDVSAAHLHGLRKRKGWKVGRASGRYVGRHRLFGAAEIAWLRKNVMLETADWHRQFVVLFDRCDVTVRQLISLRKNQGWRKGRTGQYEKGQEPANKGKLCPPGRGGRHPNARLTQFRRGQEPHNTKFLGHERVNGDGYVEISVAETNPHTGYDRRYVHKHVHLWTEKNGPVPEGYVLKCLDADKTNTDPSNWELVPRGLLPRLNGRSGRAYDKAPDALKPTIMAVAKLEHRIRDKNRTRSDHAGGERG